MKRTSLRLNKETLKKLTLLKIRKGYKTLDETINKMFKVIRKLKIEGELE